MYIVHMHKANSRGNSRVFDLRGMSSPLNLMSMMCVRGSRGTKLTRKTPLRNIFTVFGTEPLLTMISSWPSPAWVTSTESV